MKNTKIIYYISTGLLTALLLLSASMYIIKHEDMITTFGLLNFPSWIIYPLSAAKISGLLVLWFSKSETLKEWAYAGFFFNFLLAFGAHVSVGDGEFAGAVMALGLLAISYYSRRKLAAI
jgi:hypothetical protein